MMNVKETKNEFAKSEILMNNCFILFELFYHNRSGIKIKLLSLVKKIRTLMIVRELLLNKDV